VERRAVLKARRFYPDDAKACSSLRPGVHLDTRSVPHPGWKREAEVAQVDHDRGVTERHGVQAR